MLEIKSILRRQEGDYSGNRNNQEIRKGKNQELKFFLYRIEGK